MGTVMERCPCLGSPSFTIKSSLRNKQQTAQPGRARICTEGPGAYPYPQQAARGAGIAGHLQGGAQGGIFTPSWTPGEESWVRYVIRPPARPSPAGASCPLFHRRTYSPLAVFPSLPLVAVPICSTVSFFVYVYLEKCEKVWGTWFLTDINGITL